MDTDPMAEVIRGFVTAMPDAAIRGIVEGVVRGLAEGVVEVLTDRIVEHLAELGGQDSPPPSSTEVAPPTPVQPVRRGPQPFRMRKPPPPAPVPESPASDIDVVASETFVAPEPAPVARKQRAEGAQRTCEICGRTGTRRYVPVGNAVDGRWKCSPTATACAPRFKPPGTYTPPSDIPAKTIPADVTPPAEPDPLIELATGMREHGQALREQMASEPAPRPVRGPDVTARCQDCPRSWVLTGRVLDMAVEQHEQKHSHIVAVGAE